MNNQTNSHISLEMLKKMDLSGTYSFSCTQSLTSKKLALHRYMMFSTVIKIRENAKRLHSNAVIIVLWPNSDICKAPFRILMFEI